MTQDTAGFGGPDTTDMDQSWARWIAKGVAHDDRRRKRVMFIGGVVAFGLAIWLTAALALA